MNGPKTKANPLEPPPSLPFELKLLDARTLQADWTLPATATEIIEQRIDSGAFAFYGAT
jgi:hypothetical protein